MKGLSCSRVPTVQYPSASLAPSLTLVQSGAAGGWSSPERRLREGHIHYRAGFPAERHVPHVAHDADDLARHIAVRRKFKPHFPSDGVLARKITPRQRFANDRHLRIGGRILFGEKAAPQQRNSHHAKKSRTHRGVIGSVGFAGWEGRISDNGEPDAGLALAVHRERSRQRGISQAGLRLKPRQQLVGESRPLLRCRIFKLGERNLSLDDVSWVEAGTDRRDPCEAAEEEAARNQKHNGQRNFRARQETQYIIAATLASTL